jgi:hypothetical protein
MYITRETDTHSYHKAVSHVHATEYGTLCGQNLIMRPTILTDAPYRPVCRRCRAKMRLKAEIRRLPFEYEVEQ